MKTSLIRQKMKGKNIVVAVVVITMLIIMIMMIKAYTKNMMHNSVAHR